MVDGKIKNSTGNQTIKLLILSQESKDLEFTAQSAHLKNRSFIEKH